MKEQKKSKALDVKLINRHDRVTEWEEIKLKTEADDTVFIWLYVCIKQLQWQWASTQKMIKSLSDIMWMGAKSLCWLYLLHVCPVSPSIQSHLCKQLKTKTVSLSFRQMYWWVTRPGLTALHAELWGSSINSFYISESLFKTISYLRIWGKILNLFVHNKA